MHPAIAAAFACFDAHVEIDTLTLHCVDHTLELRCGDDCMLVELEQ